MKTIEIVNVYYLLRESKLNGMDSVSKFKIIRTAKKFKEITDSYVALVESAKERLKPENFDELVKKAVSDKATNEDKEICEKLNQTYLQEVNACVIPEAFKELNLDFEKLTEEQFGKLIEINSNWNVDQLMLLESIILE